MSEICTNIIENVLHRKNELHRKKSQKDRLPPIKKTEYFKESEIRYLKMEVNEEINKLPFNFKNADEDKNYV